MHEYARKIVRVVRIFPAGVENAAVFEHCGSPVGILFKCELAYRLVDFFFGAGVGVHGIEVCNPVCTFDARHANMGCGGAEYYFSVGSVRAVIYVYIVVKARRNFARFLRCYVEFVELPADFVVHCGIQYFCAVVRNIYVGNCAVGRERELSGAGLGDVVGNPQFVLKIMGLYLALVPSGTCERRIPLPILRKPHAPRSPRAEYVRPLRVLFKERIGQKRLGGKFFKFRSLGFRVRVVFEKPRFYGGDFFLPLGEF